MKNFMPNLVLEEIKEAAGGGGAQASGATASTPAGAASASSTEPVTDDLGYEIPAAKTQTTDVKGASDKAAAEAKELADKKTANDAAVKSADATVEKTSGYGDEPPKVEEAQPVTKTEEAAKTDLGYELKLDGLAKEESDKITEFAKTHKLPKEAAQAFADLRKSEMKSAEERTQAAQKEQQLAIQRTRAEWHKELKNDPSFGGEKFGYNVMQAEKVLQDFMPSTKKMLTERKSMLPPYVMRDLAKLADHLYSNEKLVSGDPAAPSKTNESDDALDFYAMKN